jgi:hypothetical protein
MTGRHRRLPILVVTVALQACVSHQAPAPMRPSVPGAMSGAPTETVSPPSAIATTSAAPEAQTDQALETQALKPEVHATFFTSPSELRDELAVHQIAPRLYAGSELEWQGNYEKQDGPASKDGYFDSVTGALRWVPFYGLTVAYEASYDLHHFSEGLSVDEFTVTLGSVATEPWYVTIGHTSLPFGEYNSHFREDPTTQVLGETLGNEIATGYQSDTFELTFAARGSDSGSHSYSWVGNLTFSPVPDMDAGAYWTSDLTKAFEIHQLIEDAEAANPAMPFDYSPVGGAGAFISIEKYSYTIDFEVIAAVDRFEAGLLTTSSQRPWAWNFEATIRPRNPWELGMRIERSSGIPDSPETQFGVESTYSFGPHAAVSLEYLFGMFNGASDRNLVNAGFLVRW